MLIVRILFAPLNPPRELAIPLEQIDQRVPYCDAAVHVCVVAQGSSDYLAFVTIERRGTLPACDILWRPEFDRATVNQFGLGAFRSPCSGATFDRDGTRLFGPSPNSLDRFEAVIEGDMLVVHLERVVQARSQ
jgi:Rieske Fe-S protein